MQRHILLNWQDALGKLAKKMHFEDCEKSGSYFGLYESTDGSTIGRALDLQENVFESYSKYVGLASGKQSSTCYQPEAVATLDRRERRA